MMKPIKLSILLATTWLTGCATTPPPYYTFDEFGVFNNPDNSQKTISIAYEDMQYEDILNNTFKAFGIETVYQDRVPITVKYKLTAVNKPIQRILQASLNIQCLSYRKLTSNTVLIYKDRSKTNCKPIPAGSEIRVN